MCKVIQLVEFFCTDLIVYFYQYVFDRSFHVPVLPRLQRKDEHDVSS
jgi:hypothetical protein